MSMFSPSAVCIYCGVSSPTLGITDLDLVIHGRSHTLFYVEILAMKSLTIATVHLVQTFAYEVGCLPIIVFVVSLSVKMTLEVGSHYGHTDHSLFLYRHVLEIPAQTLDLRACPGYSSGSGAGSYFSCSKKVRLSL